MDFLVSEVLFGEAFLHNQQFLPACHPEVVKIQPDDIGRPAHNPEKIRALVGGIKEIEHNRQRRPMRANDKALILSLYQ